MKERAPCIQGMTQVLPTVERALDILEHEGRNKPY